MSYARTASGTLVPILRPEPITAEAAAFLERVIPRWTEAGSEAEARCRQVVETIRRWSDLLGVGGQGERPSAQDSAAAVELLRATAPVSESSARTAMKAAADLIQNTTPITKETP